MRKDHLLGGWDHLSLLVIDPGIDNDLRSRVVAKKEAKSPAYPGPAPVSVILSQSVALAVHGMTRIGRYGP